MQHSITKEVEINTNKNRINKKYVYNFLSNESYWSQNLPYARFVTAVNNSLCYGMWLNGRQIGFARVVTDYSEFASIWDLFIEKEFRGFGLGKLLVKTILESELTRDVYKWFLMTKDAHDLYRQYGFTSEKYSSVMVNIMPKNF